MTGIHAYRSETPRTMDCHHAQQLRLSLTGLRSSCSLLDAIMRHGPRGLLVAPGGHCVQSLAITELY